MGKEFPPHMSFDKYSNLKGVEVAEGQPLHNEAEYLVSLLFIFFFVETSQTAPLPFRT